MSQRSHDGASDPNHRSVGKRRQGSIQTGRPSQLRQHAVELPSASICGPTGQRTTSRTCVPFGTGASRFTCQLRDSAPGPGSYHKADAVDKQRESNSKLGFGALVSGATRWGHAGAAYTGPGPGEYGASPSSLAAPSFSRAETSSNFAPSAAGKASSSPAQQPPGPGAYHHESQHRSRGGLEWLDAPRTGHHSAFKSVSRKTEFDGRHTAPPPGSYELSKAWGAEEAQRTHFKNHSSRGFSYATTPPAVGPASLIFPHDPPVSYGRAPGPGTYDLQAALSLHRKVEARFESQSAAFHPPTAPPRPRRVPGAVKLSAPQPGALLVADLGAQEADGAAAGARAQPGPGPGEYESHVAKVAIDPARGATAPFVSKVAKSALMDPQSFRNLPPGPAYYDPRKPAPHSSFHLNARKRFL